MQQNIEQLVQEIEDLRRELNSIGTKKGLKDPEVHRKSQMLDKLIVEYYKFKCN